MARTVAAIQTQIETELVSAFSDIGVTLDVDTWSTKNIIRLFAYVFAVCAAYVEQLMDTMQDDIETQLEKSVGANALWLQDKMFSFQYSATDPQTVQMIDSVAQYATVDEDLQIITACSVTSPYLNTVLLKVAKSDPLEALTQTEIDAAQAYAELMFTTGVDYTIQSGSPDKISIEADIYYDKQYAAVIKDDVIEAIEDLFLNLSVVNFNGSLKMTDIESTVRAIDGVNDIVLNNVTGRSDASDFTARVFLVADNKVEIRQWDTVAGYCTDETEDEYSLSDLLNFIGE